MTRIFRLIVCLSLAAALLAPTTVLATPADEASSPWWSTTLVQLCSHVLAPLSGGDGIDMGPDIDPDGLTTAAPGDGASGNAGPDIDPDGLTVQSTRGTGAPAGPAIVSHR